ncbi:MAG TPA: glucans biosynthesis glucosyltransferase MdoH [Methylomirabilota bacterium]|nr:glucans biosynthesis glucosyltransferase MdoH [Methylomirabilota bacterium]
MSPKPTERTEGASSPASAAAPCGLNLGWRRAARRRRIGLTLLVLAQTALATWSLARTFPHPTLSGLEIATLGIFTVLWFWISCGFWTAVAGFCVLWRNAPRFSVTAAQTDGDDGRPSRSRTAILVPICNEEVQRVFAGVEASYRSVAATGRLEFFDFYILSDTRDPETQIEEETAWAQACQAVDGFGRIFYRHRRNNIKRKSGNIADFVRRWGRNYDYMIVFDADSVMAGATLVRLVSLMDKHPEAGIIQTLPAMANRETLFARVQQFASRAYGPMLAAGLHFWQLGESYYWGHNAILRLEPFMRHCGLSRLPGNPPLGGEILSHDFVEAALMGRAGWEVWIAYDLGGSYEETPPTLLDELKRDRRWCQGNLQHVRLLFGDGIRAGHRAIMSIGVMAYASALFWAVFLVLSTVEVAVQWLSRPVYFSSWPSLFPLWPQWHPDLAMALLSTTAVLLLLPKLLGVLLIIRTRRAALFGSSTRLCASVVLEILFSTLLAPVRMWFHSKFVLLTLMGRQITWGAQRRDDSETGWSDAIRHHGASTIVALAWLVGVPSLNRSLVWWLLPVAVALLLSVPVSVYSSRVSLGRALRRWHLFLIPEESDPPEIIERLRVALKQRQGGRLDTGGFILGTNDPRALGVHIALLRGRNRQPLPARPRNRTLLERALQRGPASLTPTERVRLFRDAESIAALHSEHAAGRDVAMTSTTVQPRSAKSLAP